MEDIRLATRYVEGIRGTVEEDEDAAFKVQPLLKETLS